MVRRSYVAGVEVCRLGVGEGKDAQEGYDEEEEDVLHVCEYVAIS